MRSAYSDLPQELDQSTELGVGDVGERDRKEPSCCNIMDLRHVSEV